jgi:hypothetical protein
MRYHQCPAPSADVDGSASAYNSSLATKQYPSRKIDFDGLISIRKKIIKNHDIFLCGIIIRKFSSRLQNINEILTETNDHKNLHLCEHKNICSYYFIF